MLSPRKIATSGYLGSVLSVASDGYIDIVVTPVPSGGGGGVTYTPTKQYTATVTKKESSHHHKFVVMLTLSPF